MPTQNTKLATYVAHITGRVWPATAIPRTMWLRSGMPAVARIRRSRRNTPHQILPGRSSIRRMSALSDFWVTLAGTCSVTPTSSGSPAGSYVISDMSPLGRPGVATHALLVRHARLGVELFEHPVLALAERSLVHGALGIGQVAERDRPCRARLGAGGLELTVLQLPLLVLGDPLGLEDALHAHRALLHHALVAHRHVRVELPVERLGERERHLLGRGVVEEVERPHLVRAVVRAIPGAHAAVVDLDVEPLGVVIGGVDRAHGLTRRVAAVLAHHGHEAHVAGARRHLLLVALDADPH